MSRTERGVCGVACIAALLLLWWSVDAPPGWALWVRIGAVVLAPVTFFAVIAVQLVRRSVREEAGLTPEEIRERRRRAWAGTGRDVAPLLSRGELFLRPLRQLWELTNHTDPPRAPRDDDCPT